MTKQEVLAHFTKRLKNQLATMTEAAKKTHQAATGEEAKQEGKYDTRGLEASYLAEAQAEQAKSLSESLRIFKSLVAKDFEPDAPISMGALIETETLGDFHYYLLTPCAGGMSIEYETGELTTLSPEAPIYQHFLGKTVGDLIEKTDTLILDIT